MAKLELHDVSDETLEQIKKVETNIAFPFEPKIKYIGNPNLKKMIKIRIMNEFVQYATGVDIIVQINEDLAVQLESPSVEILLHQEYDKLQFDMDKGKIKLSKPTFTTNVGIINRYGLDAVAKANEVYDLLSNKNGDVAEHLILEKQ